MKSPVKHKFLLLLSAVLIASTAFAADIPLTNWTPAPFSPTVQSKTGPRLNIGSTAYTSSFMPMTPCRVYDSRTSGPATPLAGGTSRTIPVVTGPCAGIPAGAAAFSFNITVFGSTAGGGYAFVTAYPTGTTRPGTSTMNFLTGSQTSNAAAVPSGSGQIDLYTTATTHFTLDINGYYTVIQNAGDGFLSVSVNGYGVIGQSTNSYGVVGFSSGGAGVAAVAGSSTNAKGVYGISQNYNGVWADSTNWDAFAGFGGRDGGYFQGVRNGAIGVSTATAGAVSGLAGSTGSGDPGAAGVTGTGVLAPASPFNNIISPGVGVLGLNNNGYAVIGVTNNIGAKFISQDGAGNSVTQVYLAYPSAAGLFQGNVQISAMGAQPGNLSVAGTLTKGGGAFKIDDPIDPENKYLYHSFVESPDMMNIYNGVVELDGNGEAVVQLPAYFEALNRDFRYQLTAIGRPQPNLYIADEVANNTFRISGGRANAKVSWTVTGVRHDPFANAHRIPNEVDKEDSAKGFYLHPAEYGKQQELSIDRQLKATGAPDEKPNNR